MTRDEALDTTLERAFLTFHRTYLNKEAQALAVREAFLASLKASGWTLARVEPTKKMAVAAINRDTTEEADIYFGIYTAMLTAYGE